MTMIRGVIFDVDGTLVDSLEGHAAAWQTILVEEGVRTSWDEIIKSMGLDGEKLVPKLTGAMKSSERGSRIAVHRDRLFVQHYLPSLLAFPKASELLGALRAHSLKLAAVSMVKADEVRELLVRTGLSRFFEVQISSDDALIGYALDRLGLSPAEVLMVGGTPYDIQAAAQVSVRSVAFRCGGWSDTELHGAVAIYNDPQDLFEQLESSVFVRGIRDIGIPFAVRRVG